MIQTNLRIPIFNRHTGHYYNEKGKHRSIELCCYKDVIIYFMIFKRICIYIKYKMPCRYKVKGTHIDCAFLIIIIIIIMAIKRKRKSQK